MPLPTMMATGVASPSAQGHEMTRTAMALSRAIETPTPLISHTIMTNSAIPMTVGTNIPETLSAIRAIGALVAAASLTM